MAQPCHLAAHALDLLNGVRHQNDRGAARHQLLHPLFALLLEQEIAHRKHLVRNEDIGLGDGGNGKADAGHHAGGVVLERHIQKVLQLAELHDLIKLFVQILGREAQHRAVQIDVLAGSQVHIKARAQLDERGDGAADRHLALAGLVHARNGLEQGGLARAVQAHKAVEIAGHDVQTHVLEGVKFIVLQAALHHGKEVFLQALMLFLGEVEAHGNIVHFDDRFHCSSSLNMQHKAVLRFAEYPHAHQHGEHGAAAAHREHVEIQRDAPHHGTAEACDVPVHGIQLDDLLHVEPANGKGHLGGVVEDGGKIQQCGDEHAPDVHDIPEEHGGRCQKQAHAQTEEEQRHQRVDRLNEGQVEGCTGKDHDQQQRYKAEHAVHHGKAALFQREDILGDIHLFEQGRSAQHTAHAGGGGLVEEVEQQLAAHQEHGKVVDAAAAHVHQTAEHGPVHKAHEQRVQNAPHHAQHAAAVFELEVTADEVPQQIAVAPEAVPHCFEFCHRRSPLFKIFKLLCSKGLVQLVLCAGLVLAAAVRPLHVHGGVIVGDAALAGGVVHIGALVAELCHIAQHQKTVCEALRDVEHLLVLLGKGHAHPLAEGGAVGAAVHGHIEHLALGHAHQLALRVLLLEVQAAQHAAGGAALVVLHEFLIDAGFGKLILLIGLHKITAVVAEHLRLNDHNTGDLGLSKRKLAHILYLSFCEACLFYLEKSVRRRLLRLFAAAGLSLFRARSAAFLPPSDEPHHQKGHQRCRCGGPQRDAQQPECMALGLYRLGRFQLLTGAVLQQFRQAGNFRIHTHAGALLLFAAVDGVHSVHLRVGAKDIAFRQFQRHLHIVGSQAVGQQQPHAGVGDGHGAKAPAAAHHAQRCCDALRGQVGVAGKGAERIIQQGAHIVVFIGAQLALHGHADEPDAVLLRQTGVAVAGRVGITELGTQNGRDRLFHLLKCFQ